MVKWREPADDQVQLLLRLFSGHPFRNCETPAERKAYGVPDLRVEQHHVVPPFPEAGPSLHCRVRLDPFFNGLSRTLPNVHHAVGDIRM